MTATKADQPAPGEARGEVGSAWPTRVQALRARLTSVMPAETWWSWGGPLLITIFGGWLRFNRLSTPNSISFDETYYVKDAWSYLHHGVEWNIPQKVNGVDVNTLIPHGFTNIFQSCTGTSCGELVVMPPVGKWLIAVGEGIFGLNSFGWRFSTALFGSLAILLMCRIVRRMTRSTLLGCIAGFLLSLDGLEFVLSRTGILDIFLMFFVLAAFGCMVIDRDISRARLAAAVAEGRHDDAGPLLGIRKWRVLAGLCIGLACATKWDAVWYLLAFVLLAVMWDVGARRAAGLPGYYFGGVIRDGKWLPVTLGAIPFLTYLASWTGWLVTGTGYYRDYAAQHGVHVPVYSALYSLYEYHKWMLNFGVHLHAYQPYESQPWGWVTIARPIAYYYKCYANQAGTVPCPNNTVGYSQEILAIGNPMIWWAAIPAMLFCLGWWLTRRDWRAEAAIIGVAAGWLTWFPFVSRTKFYYYALDFLPFMIICIVLCLGLIIGPATASLARRSFGAGLAGAYLLGVLGMFWYFYPVLAAQVIPYTDWLHHMWFSSWI
jgi:dolichyl-phosphate-mannose-protein mannosyltransferase